MESHVGCSTFHPGQFCDEIDQDAVLIALYLVDFIYGRIPILETNKQRQNNSKQKKKNKTKKTKQIKKPKALRGQKGVPPVVMFDLVSF